MDWDSEQVLDLLGSLAQPKVSGRFLRMFQDLLQRGPDSLIALVGVFPQDLESAVKPLPCTPVLLSQLGDHL